jgi:hypothetical protein
LQDGRRQRRQRESDQRRADGAFRKVVLLGRNGLALGKMGDQDDISCSTIFASEMRFVAFRKSARIVR